MLKRSALISEAIRPSGVSAGAEIKQNGRPLEPDAGNADAGRPAVYPLTS